MRAAFAARICFCGHNHYGHALLIRLRHAFEGDLPMISA
jgi:hypothetical protein